MGIHSHRHSLCLQQQHRFSEIPVTRNNAHMAVPLCDILFRNNLFQPVIRPRLAPTIHNATMLGPRTQVLERRAISSYHDMIFGLGLDPFHNEPIAPIGCIDAMDWAAVDIFQIYENKLTI